MKRNFIFIGILTIAVCLPASATIINIPDDYETIQEGIDASSDGDTVLVHAGTYVENINFNGHNIVLGSLFLTTGDTTYIAETIIDGASSGSVVTFESGEDSTTVISGFTLRNGYANEGGGIYCINSDPIIYKNIITMNLAYGNFEDGSGGGIYCSNSNSTIKQNIIRENIAKQISDVYYPFTSYGGGFACSNCMQILISENIILNNIADAYSESVCRGGGIYSHESNPVIINNIIFQNNAGGIIGFGIGGGISSEDSNPIIKDNLLISNISSGDGGGINCSGLNETPTIENNIVMDNSAEGVGGGIHCLATYAVIDRCLIKGNTAYYGAGFTGFFFGGSFKNSVIVNNRTTGSGWNISGAGIFAQHSDFSITNCTISENISEDGGAGLHCGNAYAEIVNSIFWRNIPSEISAFGGSSVQILYSDIRGGWQGEGNISADPLFRDPENGDFHLMSIACGDSADSPCIDAGHPSIEDILLDCSWGLGELRSDIGAYGGGDSTTVGIDDYLNLIPKRLALMQNYPNPFNAATTLKYSLEQAEYIVLTIYNILGQRVAILFEGFQQAGEHTGTWDASDHPSGVYFVRLETAEKSESIKMLLLK